jgi:hypothetical protein
MRSALVICKKIFSVSLVFNAVLTLCCVSGILAGFYWYYHGWQPFTPYLINGNLFWVTIIAAIINIFPSAALGRSLHTGRLLFHHYVYGLIVLFCAVVYVVFFTPLSLLTIFLMNDVSVPVNIGRFFLLGGFTLLLDDLPDVSKGIEKSLNRLKFKVGQAGRLVSVIQLIVGSLSLYVFSAIMLSVFHTQEFRTAANFILIGTTFITAITSIIFVKRQVWLKIKP